MRATIFVTDDDEVVRSSITRRLSRQNHAIRSFDSGEALIEALDHDLPDIILLDLKMTGMSGLETLKQVSPKAPQALVILLTAYGTIEDAVEAMKLGAYDFLIKSVDLSGVTPVVQRALEYLALRRRVLFETKDVASWYSLTQLIVESPSMQGLLSQVQELTQNTKTTVLFQGETGTGKELSPAFSIIMAPVNRLPLSGSIVPPFPRNYSKANYSDMNEMPLLELFNESLVCVNRRKGERSF